MYIRDIFSSKKPVISFEVFPPKKDSSIDTIYSTIDALADLHPDFISVTYGAGGSASGKTVELASIIKNKYNIEALAHLTCVTSTKSEIEAILDKLTANNITNILSLRGDFPTEGDYKFPSSVQYEHADDLIRHIKSTGDFSIGAACYPEGHIECKDKSLDLFHLKNKVQVGSDFLITQLFFNNEDFYIFMDQIKSIGINVPVSAGIMPVINKKQIERITALCGASVPNKFKRILDKYENNPEALKEAGIAYATEQIIDLLSWGIDGIHIYTMNKPEIARKIVNNIASIRNVLEKEPPAAAVQ
ncbi:MAG: methylenetetrahydrofolate reductase [NAD(P)H] [Bacillota bacterium]|nr:methylenetetrahydrofolate reductase [NAD(P)H] [Bacillota bacterium]